MSRRVSAEAANRIRVVWPDFRSDVAAGLAQLKAVDWGVLADKLETRQDALELGEQLEDAANLLLDLCELISRHSKVEEATVAPGGRRLVEVEP